MNNEKKQELLNAIDTLYNEYDAFYMLNTLGEIEDNSHKKEFEILSELKGELVDKALNWIRFYYDCYYKNEYTGEETAFAYLKQVVNSGENENGYIDLMYETKEEVRQDLMKIEAFITDERSLLKL